MSAFNDALDRPEPDKVLNVQLLTLDTVVGGRCNTTDGLRGVFWKNNDVEMSVDEGLCAETAGASEPVGGGKNKGSIWKFDGHDFSIAE